MEQKEKAYWQPQPKQAEALTRLENEVLYGGARGGGKTDAGMAWLLYNIDKPRFRALVIRRNSDDLRDWIDRARFFSLPCNAKIMGQPAEIFFPSGAIIRTGHLNDASAYSKYQGHEYQNMLIEELTQIPREDDYEKLLGSNRSTVDGIIPQVFATTNPDGPGYKWVKARWNIPNEPTDNVLTTLPNGRSRIFIPSKIEDNPILMEKDPAYVHYLESLTDDDLRNAWRNGSWSGVTVRGAIYQKELSQMKSEKRITNVPYEPGLPVFTVWDLGMGDATAIGFFQKYGMEERMIDYYENSGEGFNHYFQVLQERKYVYGKHYAPHDIMVRELGSGQSRYETARNLGVTFEIRHARSKRDGTIKAKSAIPNIGIQDGIDSCKRKMSKLWIDEKKCERFLISLGQYRKEYNEKMGEWVSTPLHDWTSHAADMIRYWSLMPESIESKARFYKPRPERY